MAASAGAIRAGSAYVEIFARDGQFQQGMSRIRARMMTLGTQMRQAGTSMTIGGAALGAPFILAARSAAEFSLEMARMRAVTGANDAQFALLNERAKGLAVEFGKSPEQVAIGMGELAKAGLKAEGVLKSIAPIIAIAAGDNLDLARAVEVVVSTMSQFKMGTDSFGAIADKLRATSDSSTTSVDSLGEALTYIGPKAMSAGQDVDTILASLAVLSDAGLRGSLGGTGLSRIIESIANEEEQLAALGVSTRDQNKNMLPFMDIMEQLGKKAPTANIDAIRVMTEIFEIRGANAAISLSSMREKYDEVMQAIGGSAGSAIAKAKAVMDSFGGAVAQLGSAFKNLQSDVIESMGLTPAVQGMTRLLGVFGEFVSRNSALVTAVAAGAAATFGLGIAAIASGLALQGLATSLRVVQGALAIIPALFSPIGLAVAGVIAGIGGGVVAARMLSPAFREETDAIAAALMRLDFGTAWELMNINLFIALLKMQQGFSQGFDFVKNSVLSVSHFISDMMAEGLDRFMGVFGMDILRLQEGFQKLGYYIRWAFDWSFNTAALSKALKQVEDEVDEARARFPTADERADGRKEQRQRSADERAEQGRQRDLGFESRIKTLRDDAERAKRRGDSPVKPTVAPASPGDKVLPEKVPAAPPGAFMPQPEEKVKEEKPPRDPREPRAEQDRGISSAGNFSGVGLDIGPELASLDDEAKRTADATEATAEATRQLAARGQDVSDLYDGQRGQLVARAEELQGSMGLDSLNDTPADRRRKVDELAQVQSDLAALDAFRATTAASGVTAIAMDAVAARAPGVQQAAAQGTQTAIETSQIGIAFQQVGSEIVAAITAGTEVSKQMLSALTKIADKKPVEVAFQ